MAAASENDRAPDKVQASNSASPEHRAPAHAVENNEDGTPSKGAYTVSDSRMAVLHAKASSMPLPYEEAPLPQEAPPEDDGWDYKWDATSGAYYFVNRFTGQSQWENPRVPAVNATNYASYERFANCLSLFVVALIS
jgi:hypothetical protein